MQFPLVNDLREERWQVVRTLESLTDEQFDDGETLCEGWAPRDVLAHLLGVDTGLGEYVKAKGNIAAGNARIVERARRQTRERLMHRAEHWADRPSPLTQAGAWYLLGDVAVHHQDILRPLGMTRVIPEASAAAIYREGWALGPKRLLSHRVVPTDGGPALGRGPTVSGTREALGMWLCGRRGIEPDLSFA